jgi:fructose 1,6-bisphosphate aldolase/phosphatase
VDIFDNPAWDYVRIKAQEKALAMRDQGWSGAAMLPYNELEYSGFRDTVEGLLSQFSVRNGHEPAAVSTSSSAQ